MVDARYSEARRSARVSEVNELLEIDHRAGSRAPSASTARTRAARVDARHGPRRCRFASAVGCAESSGRGLDVLFAACIAALFSGVHQSLGPVKIQLFDALALVTMFFAAFKGFASPRPSPTVLGVLIVYLLYFTISALFVSLAMGIKALRADRAAVRLPVRGLRLLPHLARRIAC